MTVNQGGSTPDFAEMLEALEDCRKYLTEFGSVEPSALAYRVNQAITNGRRAKDDRSLREQWQFCEGHAAAKGEPSRTFSAWLAAGGE